MVGYVQTAVADAIRNWLPLKEKGVSPILAVQGENIVTDTQLPAILVHVFGTDGQGNTYIGGEIRLYFELSLHMVTQITNSSFTPDKGLQAKAFDLSEEVIRCIERSDKLQNVRLEHDMSLQFDRMTTYSTYAYGKTNSVPVDVHQIVYNGSVEFKVGDTNGYPLEVVDINNNDINHVILPIEYESS